MNKIITTILLSVGFSTLLLGQIDNEFWFAAPDVTGGHSCGPAPTGHGRPVNIYVTAEQATDVLIEMPGNPAFTPVSVSLSAGEHRRVPITPTYHPDVFENFPMSYPPAIGQSIQKKAFRITSSPGNITAYYELNNNCNRDIFAMKGKNALGTEFYVSTQNFWNNGNYTPTPYSGFVILAAEDNTTIQIHRNSNAWQFFTGAPGIETIVLNRGETFAFVANSQTAANHIMGVRVTSNKPIAITWYDDSIAKGGCRDITGDQLVPVNLIGQNYIVMKGDLQTTNGGERYFITATVNGTSIYINDNPVAVATLNAGQSYNTAFTTAIVRINATHPVYVNHISGTGTGCELGGATLPTIDGCTGSHKVTFTRGPQTNDPLRLNLMVRNNNTPGHPFHNQSIQNFTLVVGANEWPIPASYFIYTPDSSWAYLNWTAAVNTFFTGAGKITPGQTATIRNPIARFHLGLQNGGASNGGKYGYFSDYASSRGSAGIGGPKAPPSRNYCNLDPVLLAVEGGYAYQWFGDPVADHALHLSSTTESEAYFTPPTYGTYRFRVLIYRECFADTSIFINVRIIEAPIADFIVDNAVGCSPYEPLFTNNTNFALTSRMVWNFNVPHFNDTISQFLLTNPFNHLFPENHTDTLQHYQVRLRVWGPFNSCPSEREKIVTIKPGTKSVFNVDTTAGCSPLPIQFNNLSEGHIKPTGYQWDFGDNTQSFDSIPTKTFINYSLNDTIFQTRLIVTSPFDCQDTAFQDITVHPYLKGSMALDTAFACSPLAASIKVFGSVGVDTFKWHVDYSDKISQFNTANYLPVPISHTDTSTASPDTVKINLITVNRMGCRDTVPERRIIVNPRLKADFTIDHSVACDSQLIVFSNLSSGYKLRYFLDFGDGVTLTDTVQRDYVKRYFNRSNASKIYSAKLTTVSNNLCLAQKDTTILIHPYVEANFGVDFLNNCAPLNVSISNQSTRGHIFEWDFGDGNTSSSGAVFLTHQYWNPQSDRDTTYYLKLRVTSPEGCLDSTQQSILLFPQVVAAFNMNIDAGCNPMNVIFQNNSTGKELMYNWKFGPEMSSSTSSPVFERTFGHFGAQDSTFNVVLKAFNPYGCDSTISRPVTLYAYIDAAFVVERSDSCSPFKVRITNTSPPGAKFYEWDFGDGNPISSLKNPTHQYENTGLLKRTDQLRLVVNNDHACYDTLALPINIYPEINAAFTVDKVQGCQPLVVNFTANNTNITTGTNFHWDFNDGTFSTQLVPTSKQYINYTPNSLTRNIKLSATSQFGCNDTISQAIEVYPFILAKFAIDKSSVCSNEPFVINRSASQGAIDQYQWDFNNDGFIDATTTTPVFSHSYMNEGTSSAPRIIRLRVTNAQGCDTSWYNTINVHPKVTANFESQDFLCFPEKTIIRNTSPNRGVVPTKFFWDFGDGSGALNNESAIEHRFPNYDFFNSREYDIRLIAESDYFCSDTLVRKITVHPKPKADFITPVAAACPPFNAEFQDMSRGTNLSYAWNFGDGNTSIQQNPTNTYYNPGSDIATRQVNLMVTTAFSCRDTVTKPMNTYPKVSVNFDASAWSGCHPLNVDFNGFASNHSHVIWDIDDNSFSTMPMPTYRFTNTTPDNITYNVRFKAGSVYNCSDELTKQVTIYPQPTVGFTPTPYLQNHNTETDVNPVTLFNQTNHQGIGPWLYSWDYGDGTEDNASGATVVKNYVTWGDIKDNNRLLIWLKAENKDNPQCRDSVWHEVIINPPLPQVTVFEDVDGCVPLFVGFESKTKYTYEDNLVWDFGLDTLQAKGPQSSFTYEKAGIYMAKLLVRGDGGEAWDYKKVTVHPKPVMAFTYSPELVLLGSATEPHTPVKFFNNTQQGETFLWELGDGEYSTAKEPEHIYYEKGHKYVLLTATSAEGCIDTLTKGPIIVEGTRLLKYPNAIIISQSGPKDEQFNPLDTEKGIFRPIAQGIESYRLEIYNRWGELIWHTEDINVGWNGYVKGQMVKQDVYVWKVKATFTDGKPMTAAGDVTVLIEP